VIVDFSPARVSLPRLAPSIHQIARQAMIAAMPFRRSGETAARFPALRN
jgi:hypothetical protein